jgi:tetratricopeptide (TPR) repeat protein
MNCQAELHKCKSEYIEARNIHTQILRKALDQDPYDHVVALLNVAELDVSISAPKDDVQRNIDAARKILNTTLLPVVTWCDIVLADLYLRERDILAAKILFENCLNRSRGKDTEAVSYCLEKLGDASQWGALDFSGWTTVFLAHALKFKEKLGIHKALQFLGEIVLTHGNEDTAISLFTVALEGFTYMDVHHSRAECMLKLADIAKRHGNVLKAVNLWETARSLFERSSQAKQVENIHKRLAGVSTDVLEQYSKNLVKFDVPPGTVEDIDDLPEIEDLDGLDLKGGKENAF